MQSVSLHGVRSWKGGQLVPSQGPRTAAPTSAKKMVRRPVPYRKILLSSHTQREAQSRAPVGLAVLGCVGRCARWLQAVPPTR